MEHDRMDLTSPCVGTDVGGAACVVEMAPGTTRRGSSYLTITLRNRTGSIRGKVWEEQLPQWDGIGLGDVVLAKGKVNAGWNGGPPEIAFVSVGQLPCSHPVAKEINPVCPTPFPELVQRFRDLRGLIQRPAMALLLDVVIEHVGRDAYCTAPAAVSHHHAYIHGLLEHSVEVAEIAVSIAARPAYNTSVDLDAVIVGALLHDLGKVQEYEWEGVPIAVSPRGRLVHHVTLGPMLTQHATSKRWRELRQAGLRDTDVHHLVHTQHTHHGAPEWGSPLAPVTPEAQIVHHADNSSAKVRAITDACLRGEASDDGWIANPGWPHRRPVLFLRHLLPADRYERAASQASERRTSTAA